MTGRDLMPFGKFKGQPLSTIDKGYADWLCRQDGFSTKNPALYKYFTEGEQASSTAEERQVIEAEPALLDPMPPAFKAWWRRAYGERMRVHGQLNYIAFLRVACESWRACAESASVPDLNKKPAMLPPPLSHIPAPPGYDPLKQDLKNIPTTDNRDEDVGF